MLPSVFGMTAEDGCRIKSGMTNKKSPHVRALFMVQDADQRPKPRPPPLLPPRLPPP
jgi:hypothetical protein